MVRMADILKKENDKKEIYNNLFKKPQEKIETAPPVIEKGKIYSRTELEKIYFIVVDFIEIVYNKIKEQKPLNEKDEANIYLYNEAFVDQLLKGNDELLGLFNLPSKEIYLYNHIANVCILAIDVGIGLGYNRPSLIRLGIISLLHDIGSTRFYDLITQPRKLTNEEYSEVKKSTVNVREYLSSLKNEKEMIAWINSVNAKNNSFIQEKTGDKTDESIYIVTIVEIYEAMTHMRPHREKIHPFEALQELIDKKNIYEERILKTLIERIGGPYPVDTYVKMNSGEDGRVIKRNLGFLLRPVVEIMYDAYGNRYKEAKIIDLVKQPTQFIKRYLRDEEIPKEK